MKTNQSIICYLARPYVSFTYTTHTHILQPETKVIQSVCNVFAAVAIARPQFLLPLYVLNGRASEWKNKRMVNLFCCPHRRYNNLWSGRAKLLSFRHGWTIGSHCSYSTQHEHFNLGCFHVFWRYRNTFHEKQQYLPYCMAHFYCSDNFSYSILVLLRNSIDVMRKWQ